MAVSYLSRTFKSSPYVLPLDLGLFSKVLETKQKQSDLNAQRIQSGIDQLGQLDVMKGVDREYLNGKIKNLVSTINNYGGKDFSDPNVFNQIEGLGSDIYGDSNIINAISSTRSVRKLMNGYEQYKSNPKLSKLYSPVNEAYDMSSVSKWLQGDKVGETYQGPSSASPYTPYKENHLKEFNKIVADKTTGVTVDGMYILKNSNERITPDRLMSMAADLLTPDERLQMKKDGWYLYSQQLKMSPQEMVSKAGDQYNERITDATAMEKYYEAQANASVADPAARANFNLLADQKTKEITELTKNSKNLAQTLASSYTKDPEEFMYQLYSNDYFRGLANRFSVSRQDATVTPNYAEIAKQKLEQSASQFDRKLDAENQWHYNDLYLKGLEKGLKMTVDPTTGKIDWVPVKGVANTLSSTNVSTDTQKTTKKTLSAANDSIKLQIQSVWDNFYDEFLQKHPELSVTAPGQRRVFVGQAALEGETPGIQPEDWARLDDNAVRAKLIKDFKDRGISNYGEELRLLDQLHRNMQAAIDGEGSTNSEIPKEFIAASDKANILKQRVTANQALIDHAVTSVYNDKGLTDQEVSLYNQYRKNPKAFETERSYDDPNSGTITYTETDDRIVKIANKVGNIDDEVDKKLGGMALGGVFKTKTISPDDKNIKQEEVSSFLWNEMSKNHGEIMSGDKATNFKAKDLQSMGINIEDVRPSETGMYADGTGRFYISAQINVGKDKVPYIYRVPISDENASKLGLERNPYESLDYAVTMLGQSDDIPIYVNKNLALTVYISKNHPNDPNDNASTAIAKVFTLGADGKKIPDGHGGYKFTSIPLPNTDGFTPTEAYLSAYKKLWEVGNNSLGGMSTKQLIELLQNAGQ